jgi:hypothetical protein
MLILGQKYNFTKLELQRLDKTFNDIQTIIYKDKISNIVISQIELSLLKSSVQVIVLNTKAKVDNEIIKYLTNLKYSDKHNKVRIISIEHFLEEYLFKCYIPESNDALFTIIVIAPLAPTIVSVCKSPILCLSSTILRSL